jgi:hypothetical protein
MKNGKQESKNSQRMTDDGIDANLLRKPDIVFGVNKKGLSAIELMTFEDGEWKTVTEDIYRIAEQKMRDLLYLAIFQPKSED